MPCSRSRRESVADLTLVLLCFRCPKEEEELGLELSLPTESGAQEDPNQKQAEPNTQVKHPGTPDTSLEPGGYSVYC